MAARPHPHNPMPESRYEVLALFTGAMVGATLFIMATGTMLPFLETQFHLGQTQLGLVLSMQLVGAVATTSVAGMLTDRFGDKKVVLWTSWFMGISLMTAAALPNFGWLLFWLFMYGVGFAAVTPAGSHAIVYFFSKEERGFAMGIRQCGMPLGGVIGSILLPAIAIHFDYQWALVAAGIGTATAGTIASGLYREPAELEGECASIRAMVAEMISMLRDARLVLVSIVSMVLICAQVAVMGFFTLTIVHEAQYSIPIAVMMFTLSQLGAIAGRISWGWTSDKIFKGSRTIPLALVCVATAAACLLISFVSPATPVAAMSAIAVFVGFSAVGWFGLVVIALAEIGGDEHSGSALGAGLTFCFVASFFAPMLFGALAETRGFPLAWQALAVLLVLGVLPAALATRLNRAAAAA